MEEARIGRQTPTQSFVLPYTRTLGDDAISLYNSSERTAQQWQELLIYDIMAVGEDGHWVHTKFGIAIPRRNGKNEIVVIRELWGILHGQRILHTAHRTTTSTSASRRLAARLAAAGYQEVSRIKKGVKYDRHYTYSKQNGLERIVILIEGGGTIDFRTRSSKGGLGEGCDLLVIDEAQEYTDDQETALKYVVTDSQDPQTIFCGTPPTTVSVGTIFPKLRTAALQGESINTGWAEWSVEEMTDPMDREAWYDTNPSLGTILTERAVLDETGGDKVDFNIQRLGLWIRYNQRSAISRREWEELQCKTLPAISGKLFVGIKYGRDGANVAMSIAVSTVDGRFMVEGIDYQPQRNGHGWILDFLRKASVAAVVVDGASGQELLAEAIKQQKLRPPPTLPTVKEVVTANAGFMQALFARTICHMGQPSMVQIVSNCEKRAIGTGGGYGFKSILDGAEVALMDSMVLAVWACQQNAQEPKTKQKIRY